MPERRADDIPILDELGDALLAGYRRDTQPARVAEVVARLRVRRGRGGGLSLLFATVLVLAAAAAAGAATYYVLHASPIAPFSAEDVPAEQRVAPGTSHVLELRARDPGGRAPAWALRLARSDTGLVCGTVGQVVDGSFGLVGLDRRFRAVPEINADACGQSSRDAVALLGTRIFDAPRYADVRTVIDGVAGADLSQVLVGVRGRTPRPVAHSGEGAFLVAAAGYPEDLQPVVVLRWRDGHTQRVALAASPFIVPDPLGGQAWHFGSFTSDRKVRTFHRGRRTVRVPVYTCVSFTSARGGRDAASSPPACGRARYYPRPDRTLFFTTRRLSGHRDPYTTTRTSGAWNKHAPRTAVWGDISRDLAREIVVTAPGVRRAVRPTVNGSFLVLMALTVDPAHVRVEVRLRGGGVRRFGPSFGLVDPKEAM
ncbi:MAG: hypothetical protein JWO74_2540 [Solirubrobacterales bacterium]|nr:hypothetical protein [Solirubrobacterales bacterium]